MAIISRKLRLRLILITANTDSHRNNIAKKCNFVAFTMRIGVSDVILLKLNKHICHFLWAMNIQYKFQMIRYKKCVSLQTGPNILQWILINVKPWIKKFQVNSGKNKKNFIIFNLNEIRTMDCTCKRMLIKFKFICLSTATRTVID